MGKNSYVLIHQLSVDIGGTYSTLKVEMKNNKTFMKHTRKICQELTNIPEDILERLLTQDINLTARKCLDYGIAHELV